jgi:D-alanyl-D-alanine carboxypeptidase/D-alanyl-D-alanine-endopeptidase (penicillin-binding protein 4)
MSRRTAQVAAAVVVLLGPAWGARADRAEEREALKKALNSIIDRTPLARSRVAVQVVSLDDGSVVYRRNADELLNPASNVKLFSSAAALVRLGPEHRFDTEFLVDRPQAARPRDPVAFSDGGELKGSLYVRGKGDPALTTEKLWTLGSELFHTGLRTVGGDLVLDDSYFDDEPNGPGFDQERSDRPYMAPVGALSLNWNTIAVYASAGEAPGTKGRVDLEPSSDFFTVENNTGTVHPRGLRRVTVRSLPQGDKQKLVVNGRLPQGLPPSAVYKKIDQPAFYFGHSLKEVLAFRGIKVKGKVRRGITPADVQTLLVHQSDTLELLLKKVNKSSSNFTAEQVLKTLGAKLKGAGTWPAGVSVVEEFLSSEVGIPRGTYIMKNGSGLNDTNRFSAAQICRLLVHMWNRFPLAPEFMSSLGIAAKDGTIHHRMVGTDASGRLRAKTGTLENVTALSGYVQSIGGERFVFAMMVNDYPERAGPVIAGLDAIGAAIAASGSPEGPALGAAKAFGAPSVPGPMAELKARIATYESLSAMRDRRNVAFLRTALSTERDPALRAVVADAVYRSDPDDYAGARTLLDNFDSGVDVLGRLREVSRELAAQTPVVPSLLRLAAEGNAEALSRVIEILALSKTDQALMGELLEPLAEVSRNAPEELIVTLRAAREGVRDAALDVIAKSLCRAAEADHPFPLAVRRMQGSRDPALASFARALDEGLSIRIAAEKEPKEEMAKDVPPAAAPKEEPKPGELRPGG